MGLTYTIYLRSGQQISIEDPLEQASYVQRDFEGFVKSGNPRVGRYSIKSPAGKERDFIVRFEEVALVAARPCTAT